MRAKKGAGRSPVDRGRPGSKHHVICDGGGVPLAVITTGGNLPDIARTVDLVEAIPPVRGRPGRPRRRPKALLADKGYDSARSASRSPPAASCRSSLYAAPPASRASGSSAGSSNKPSPYCTNSGVSQSAGNDDSTSTKDSYPSPAPSSASEDSQDPVRSSYIATAFRWGVLGCGSGRFGLAIGGVVSSVTTTGLVRCPRWMVAGGRRLSLRISGTVKAMSCSSPGWVPLLPPLRGW